VRLAPDAVALSDEHAYAAAIEELDSLAFSEAGTPPARRFEELVQLIEEFDARRHGYLLLPRTHRAAYTRNAVLRITEVNPSNAQGSRAPSVQAARRHARQR